MAYQQVVAGFRNELLDHDAHLISDEKLAHYCNLICEIVGEKAIAQGIIKDQTVSSYYKISSLLYRNFHSSKGAMHLPIAEETYQRHHEKLLFQANTVGQLIAKNDYKRVLELGCGMGFNGNYLASKFADVQFTALDLTPSNIKFAKKNAPASGNIQFLQHNFDNLKLYGNYDLIYSVETLCHSKDIKFLIENLSQHLNPGGRIIIFDGYIKPTARNLEALAEKEAFKLISWGFAMDRFQTLEEVIDGAEGSGLQVIQTIDYSKNVLSNLLAFQKGAIKVLRYPYLLKVLKSVRLLPDALMKQIAAGLFSAHFVQTDYLGYYQIELKYTPDV